MKKKRNKKISPIVLTERDKAIILSVYENRFMKRDQIQRLYFAGTSVPACNMRLKKLYDHRFLDRLIRPVAVGSKHIVYALDRHGAGVVATTLQVERRSINWNRDHNRVEFLFMEHTLAVSEFKVNLDIAIGETNSLELLFYFRENKGLQARVSDPSGKKKYLVVAPDAFFGIRTERGNSFFFLEVDMGTETLKRFANKIIAYKQYWKSGKYKEAYGFNHFRVLTVAESERRLANLIGVAQEVGAKRMFLFALMSDIQSQNPLSRIWLSPISLNREELF